MASKRSLLTEEQSKQSPAKEVMKEAEAEKSSEESFCTDSGESHDIYTNSSSERSKEESKKRSPTRVFQEEDIIHEDDEESACSSRPYSRNRRSSKRVQDRQVH